MMTKLLQRLNLLALMGVAVIQIVISEAALAQSKNRTIDAAEALAKASEETTNITIPIEAVLVTEQNVSKDQFAQLEATPIQIIDVRLETTESGLQLLLETASGALPTPTTTESGNALIIDIPNAALALEAFEEFGPTEGIALVQVSELSDDRVQIAITGSDAVPMIELASGATGLSVSVVPGVAQAGGSEDDALQLLVTGDSGSDYVELDASTASRTDTPLRDIPRSIQIIPQEVIEDQGIIRLNDALRNVSGVVAGSNDPRGQRFNIRGFDSASVLRDGFRLTNGNTGNSGFSELANIEQIEVLKGPASILFGNVQPGGVINLVSEQPLSESAYEVDVKLGNRGLVEGSLDAGGPLDEDGRVRYRLNALRREEEYYRAFDTDVERLFLAPVLSFDISDRTNLTLDLEFRGDERPSDFGLVAIGNEVADIPFDRVLGDPGDILEGNFLRTGYRLEHSFSDQWKLRNFAAFTRYDTEFRGVTDFLGGLNEATGNITYNFLSLDQPTDTFEVQTNVVGEFATGSIDHKLLVGFDFYRREEDGIGRFDLLNPFVFNIFNPVYGQVPRPDFDQLPVVLDGGTKVNSYGFYIQDQISLTDNLKVLAGLRYETFDQENINRPSFLIQTASTDSISGDAFSPQLGVVYQPVEPLSLFASYSRSFRPNAASTTAAGDVLDPEEGEQFEVGARAELLDGQFIASVAYFDITKQNVATRDPNNFLFSVPVGEQSSQGVEVDLIGEISPGWNLVANYAYTDAEITRDNSGLQGNDLFGVPEHNFNLWTTYDIQSGPLEGLGVGIGFNAVGERFGDNANSFVLDDYFLTNAAVSYQRDNWELGLNIRNLFDENYVESAENSRTTEVSPGEGFTLVGSFNINF
ncbi:MAG: TonB-dependent receptor [Cyanobacteria bacterium P01_D01_bin.115]